MSSVKTYECTEVMGVEEENEQSEKNITSVRFDCTGKNLAIGDSTGNVSFFTASDTSQPSFTYSFCFTSHKPSINTLTSAPISQRITDILWLSPQDKYHKIVTSNAHQLKLWKFHTKSNICPQNPFPHFPQQPQDQSFQNNIHNLPPFNLSNNRQKQKISSSGQTTEQQQSCKVSVSLRSCFPCSHTGPINSTSLSLNEQFMLSTDAKNAFLWSMERPSTPYQLPAELEKGQSITCSVLHPETDNVWAFGTSKGSLALGDLRVCTHDTLRFDHVPNPQAKFLCDLIKSYSGVSFAKAGKYLVTRDLISIKVWDVCNNRAPLRTILVDNQIKTNLCTLFEEDCLDDCFKVTPDSTARFVTGNYTNSFNLFDLDSEQNYQYQLDYEGRTVVRDAWGPNAPTHKFNAQQKVLLHHINPVSHQIVVPSGNYFFIYSPQRL